MEINAGDLMEMAARLAISGNKKLLGSIIKEGRVSNTAKNAVSVFEEIRDLRMQNSDMAIKAISESIQAVDKVEYTKWLKRAVKEQKGSIEESYKGTELNENIHTAIVGTPIRRAKSLEYIAKHVLGESKKAELPFSPLEDESKNKFVMEYAFSDEVGRAKIYEGLLKSALTYMSSDLSEGSLDSSTASSGLKSLSECGMDPEGVFRLYEFVESRKNEGHE